MTTGYYEKTVGLGIMSDKVPRIGIAERLRMENVTPDARKIPTATVGSLPPRVLIAEDEHLVAASLVELLHHLNVGVIGPVANGHEAVELAKRDRPDMAMLDIRMPVMDGLEAAAAMAKLGVPCVIVSAYSESAYLERGTEAGIFGYLLKPVTADDMRVGLTMAWSRYQKHVQLSKDVTDLKAAIEERKIVERAKGLIMDRLKIGEAEAMRRLQKQARDTRRKLFDVASGILESDRLLNGGEGETRPL